MIASIKGNTFLIFMGFDILATIFCFFFVKETRGKNLEVAAGTEWEVAEKLSNPTSETEQGRSRTDELGGLPDREIDTRLFVDKATGKTPEIIDIHDNFY